MGTPLGPKYILCNYMEPLGYSLASSGWYDSGNPRSDQGFDHPGLSTPIPRYPTTWFRAQGSAHRTIPDLAVARFSDRRYSDEQVEPGLALCQNRPAFNTTKGYCRYIKAD